MKVATWNVNNVRKRLPQLLAWLEATSPDVVALQELKTETAAFPRAEIEAAGYGCLVAGQRTWNGVALLSKGFDPIEVRRTLPGDPADKQARFLEAAINGVAVACLYLPNGNPQPGPKFGYKLAWFERLIAHAAELMASGNPVILAGDFNVVPTDFDIYSPDHWRDNALLQPAAREAYARLLAQGWTDSLRQRFPDERIYTFWDYLRKRWPRNAGLRIDHILASPNLNLVDAGVDREMRGNEEPSDHAPAWAELVPAKFPRPRAKKVASVPTPDSRLPLETYNARRDFAITAGLTPDGNVNHPAFNGVRAARPATAIARNKTTGQAAPPAAAGRKSVKVTNPDRVIDPTSGFKKVDLVRYYESIADYILPHLKGRPASLVRAPDGIAGKLFFQKHDEAKLPGLTQLDAALWPGHDALLAVDTAQALVSAAQMNVVEFHTWNSLARNINKPDRVIFDLDPGEGVTWANLQEAAVLMRTLLTELGLQAWLKTSGGQGLHVVVPLAPRLDYDTVKNFSQAAVRHMAKVIPSRFVAVAGGDNRVGKIFIDYLRNGHAQTTAAAFSARSRPGLGVSMPVSWELLSSLKGGAQWTIATAREYVSFQKSDPWAEYWKTNSRLPPR